MSARLSPAALLSDEYGETQWVRRSAAPSLDEAWEYAGFDPDEIEEGWISARLVGMRPRDPLGCGAGGMRGECNCGQEVRLGAPGSEVYWRIEVG